MLDGLPWPLQLLLALVFVLISMVIIMYACDGFEPAADHLGTEVYKMGPGIRGASIEAVASSLPELFTTMFLLFVFHDEDGFSAGIATCAGSAIFNGAVIPALCILAVTIKGVENDDGVVEKVTQIELYRGTLIRDGCFFLGAEIILIVFLNGTALSWWMGLVLMLFYVCYAVTLVLGVGIGPADDDDNEDGGEPKEGTDEAVADEGVTIEEGKGTKSGMMHSNPMLADGEDTEDSSENSADEVKAIAEEDEDSDQSVLVSILTFDFNELIFGGKDFTAQSAWTVVLLETVIIAAACYILAEAVMLSAKALGVQPYFTAVILGAAASSVPDTYISYKDAMKGDYDDAIANAIGSNIFDICFALGFPLMLYGLIYGDVSMLPAADGGETGLDGGSDVAEIQSLRILLIFCSVLMMCVFLLTKTEKDANGYSMHIVDQSRAFALLGIYAAWTILIILHATDVFEFDM